MSIINDETAKELSYFRSNMYVYIYFLCIHKCCCCCGCCLLIIRINTHERYLFLLLATGWCHWNLARTVFIFFYRLSIVEYRILIIDRTNHHSTVNCHKLFFFFINIIIFICYIYIYFFVFLICSLQMRVMKIHLLCIDVSIFSDLIFFYLLVW